MNWTSYTPPTNQINEQRKKPIYLFHFLVWKSHNGNHVVSITFFFLPLILQSNFSITQNRLANLDRDNNPASCTAILNGGGGGGVGSGGGVCFANLTDCSSQINLNENSSNNTKAEGDIIESPVYSFSTMTTPSHENLLLGNVGSCDPLFGVRCDEQIDLGMR